jgi:hypothetical protein
MRLAAILLALIAGTHYTSDLLSMGYENQAQASRIIFYVLRGLEGAALFLVCGILARNAAVSAVCMWGFIEEAQTAGCQMARGIMTTPYKAFSGLCGAEFYWLGIGIAAVIAVMFLDKIRGKK